ncbi:MAG: DUF29 domain-containing protein, partial [Nostoc sp. JL33]
MTAPQPTPFTDQSLYDQDFYLWIETIAKKLKQGRLAEVDLANLIEEIESMGRSEKQALDSNLIYASRTLVTSSHELGAPYFH